MKAFVACWLLAIGCWCSALGQTGQIEKLDNQDKSFTLIKNDTLNESGVPVLKYKVMRNADKRVVVEGSVTMGLIEWTATYELTESTSLGTASTMNLRSRKIDLRPFLIKY